MLLHSDCQLLWDGDTSNYKIVGELSPLITWQDQRCSDQFISGLPESVLPLSTGHYIISCFILVSYVCLQPLSMCGM